MPFVAAGIPQWYEFYQIPKLDCNERLAAIRPSPAKRVCFSVEYLACCQGEPSPSLRQSNCVQLNPPKSRVYEKPESCKCRYQRVPRLLLSQCPAKLCPAR